MARNLEVNDQIHQDPEAVQIIILGKDTQYEQIPLNTIKFSIQQQRSSSYSQLHRKSRSVS